eukprot:CAMPEP_0196802446 /NCGR_PEP_ID=MMETSP1362-20130617/2050_1 /TAXON_ID=163516 /ORGANISM="Leptocylindrus danicus, Strain CCMP1856" /LENGTH=398 /DNA_ID=CAMNT_0042173747 /DNA_START=115 /DNA_END=1311 /DNA_ORIENTATION=-
MMMRAITLLYTLFCILSNHTPAEAFTLTNCNTAVSRSTYTCRAQISSSFNGRRFTKLLQTHHHPSSSRSNTKLSMFLQEGGGILGIGTPEIAVIALVGYFVLGPEDLYKVVKEIGKFITNVRQVATETTANFESSMESQLQIKELQKASQELNDAFSFRRSINFDEAAPPSSFAEDAAAVTAAGAAVANSKEGSSEEEENAVDDNKPKKRKKVRRRKKVVEEQEQQQPIMEIPDELEMPVEPASAMAVNTDPVSGDDWFDPNYQVTADEEASRAARMARLEAASDMPNNGDNMNTASGLSPQEEAAAQSRFAAQLSANWNEQIMSNQDALEPLGKVMERLAILEEERVAAEKRLEEEFRLRSELEEKFYLSKRELLEEAAAEIQMAAYENMDTNETVS